MGLTIQPTANNVNYGKVISVKGGVVDVLFKKELPTINTLLRTGKNNEIVIEVLVQLSINCVRGIALTPTQGLSRGMKVESSNQLLMVGVSGVEFLIKK
ncbi:MAG TPA: hypothetical protein VLB84_12935 [Bacteroidia bacterium]|jgi:F-type H+-transporting ATPase subunit beta|nr:hypothetical protein [Bacteroidia bacterium]